jgi:GH15 family glucan-1,4-alpha-glucosidase
VFLTSTYTTSVVYAALLAAADLAEAVDDADSAVKWRSAAEDIRNAAHKHLYNPSRRSFYKGIISRDGQIEHNDTIDTSSVFGAFMFGLFAVGSEELQSAVQTLTETFGVNATNIGLPRYENDTYYRSDPASQGNWWFITSLWLAQYYLETEQTDRAQFILGWVRDHASSTGVLSEQLNPADQTFISVAPLTWSHAEYVASLLDTITEKQ